MFSKITLMKVSMDSYKVGKASSLNKKPNTDEFEL